jgi:hypothetical protein
VTGKEKVRFGFGARRLMVVFLGGGQTKPPGPSVRSLPCFSTPRVCAPVDRGPGRDDARSRRRRGRRGPVRDAPFRERPHRDARSSRRAMLRREVRRITRLPIVATVASRSGGDRGASAAGNEEEDAEAHLDLEDCTLRADLRVLEERGDDARSAPGRVRRATRRRATDAGMSASSDEALHRWRCKTRSHPGAGSTPARAFATRHVSRTHLEVTDTLPATRAADMVMADMFVEGCAKVAARSARWNASNTHGLAFLSIKNLEPRSRFR